jgi:hypothetical protein
MIVDGEVKQHNQDHYTQGSYTSVLNHGKSLCSYSESNLANKASKWLWLYGIWKTERVKSAHKTRLRTAYEGFILKFYRLTGS